MKLRDFVASHSKVQEILNYFLWAKRKVSQKKLRSAELNTVQRFRNVKFWLM